MGGKEVRGRYAGQPGGWCAERVGSGLRWFRLQVGVSFCLEGEQQRRADCGVAHRVMFTAFHTWSDPGSSQKNVSLATEQGRRPVMGSLLTFTRNRLVPRRLLFERRGRQRTGWGSRCEEAEHQLFTNQYGLFL